MRHSLCRDFTVMSLDTSLVRWIHLFGNLKISIILVAANLLHLLQIRKNGQSKVQNFASEIDIKK